MFIGWKCPPFITPSLGKAIMYMSLQMTYDSYNTNIAYSCVYTQLIHIHIGGCPIVPCAFIALLPTRRSISWFPSGPFARLLAPLGAKGPSLQVKVEANPTMAAEGGSQARQGGSDNSLISLWYFNRTIWRFPKMGGTPKWIVYNEKS